MLSGADYWLDKKVNKQNNTLFLPAASPNAHITAPNSVDTC